MKWLKQFFLRRKLYDDLDAEIALHLEERVEELVAGGMSPGDARAAAHREFGNVQLLRETAREAWGWRWLEDLLGDLRFAFRMLRKNPSFAVISVLTLALGIGGNAAVFCVVNAVLLKPLNYPHSEELVALHQTAPGAEGLADFENGLLLSPSMYVTYSEHNRTFQSMGAWGTATANVTGLTQPEQVRMVGVSDGVFETLGVPPEVGRWFSPVDQIPGNSQAVMLSDAYWQSRFGGNRNVLGQRILVDAQPREIIGVMPRGFRFADSDFDLIVPLAFDRRKLILSGFGLRGIARLKPEATIPQANADITRMLPIWMDSWSNGPGTNPHIFEKLRITPMIRPLKQEVTGNVGEFLWVVMGAIAVVMLIACANVANLLLVKVEARRQELGVRAALGAGRVRLVRTLLAESVMLGLIGGVVGIALACAGVRLLVALGPSNLPRLSEITIDVWTLGFTLVLSIISGSLFGLIPALKYVRPRVNSTLEDSGRTIGPNRERHRTRNSLVVGQVAMALVLLISAALMIRTFAALRKVDPGFTDPRRLQVMRISIPDSVIAEPERVARTQNAILDKLVAIPGVLSAGFATEMPLEGLHLPWNSVYARDKAYSDSAIAPSRLYKDISPGFLQTAGTRLVAGREMTWSEVYALRPVVMVSENFARELWGTPSAAVGKYLRESPNMAWHEVVGVIQDVPEKGVQEKAPEIVYWPPLVQNRYAPPVRTATFIIRSDRAGTESFLNEIRAAVWSVNSNLPLASMRTMQEVFDKSVARTSFTLVMLGIAGSMALALGVIGIYGVMSYTVSQRKREIGVRMALGARDADVLQMVLTQGTQLALLGVAIGFGAALGFMRLMANLLYGVSAYDPLTFAAVAAALIVVTLFACYIPARRAVSVDPMVALRYE